MIRFIEHLKLGAFIFVAATMGCEETVLAWERSESVRQHCKVISGMKSLSTHRGSPRQTRTPFARASSGSDLPYPTHCTQQKTHHPPLVNSGTPSSPASAHPARAFARASSPTVFGAHFGAELDAPALARFERIVHDADALAMGRCVQIIITASDFTERLKVLGWDAVTDFAGAGSEHAV